jgi:hypothetical protein
MQCFLLIILRVSLLLCASSLFSYQQQPLEEQSPRWFQNAQRQWSLPDSVCFYGKPLCFRFPPPENSAQIPYEQLTVIYRYGQQPAKEYPFAEKLILPRVPASATSANVALVWKPDGGKQRIILQREIPARQAPPEINGTAAQAAMSPQGQVQRPFNALRDKRLVPPPDFTITVKGITIDYAIPTDTKPDSALPLGRRIDATWRDVKSALTPIIDYNSPNTVVYVYNGTRRDTVIWVASYITFVITNVKYHAPSASFLLTIQVRNLPPIPPNETRTLTGSVAIKMAATLTNAKAGVSVSTGTQRVVVPLAVSYGTGLTNVPTGLSLPLPSKRVPPVGARLYHRQRYDENNPPPAGVTSWVEEYDEDETPLDSTKLISPVCAQCSDKERKFPVWKVCDSLLQSRVYKLLTSNHTTTSTIQQQTTPMLLCGQLKRNGAYEPIFIRVGEAIFTRAMLRYRIPQKVQDTLFAPITERGYGRYCFQTLSPKEQERLRTSTIEEAVSAGLYHTVTSVTSSTRYTYQYNPLSSLSNYSHAGFALFEADRSCALRFRETLTPSYPRSPALDSAEASCRNSAAIKRRIASEQYVPQALIDAGVEDGAFPPDCAMVRDYYTSIKGLVRIGRVYAIVNMRGGEPSILGVVCIQAPTHIQQRDPDFLRNALNGAIQSGTLSNEQLHAFATQEYIIKNGRKIPVKGSIENTPYATMHDYLMAGLREGRFKDCTAQAMSFPTVRGK